MLLMVMLAVFSAGMIYMVQSEARLSGMDMEGTQAYYGASAAMEKIVVDLNALYAGSQEPTVADIQALGGATYYPSLPGVTYTQYNVSVPNTGGIPDIEVRSISGGPSHGLMADIIPVTLSVTAEGAGGEIAEMTREVEIARIPVFQFGVFSDADLSYFSNGLVQLRSRVHTNGNLFLTAGSTKDLVFYSRVSAAKEVVRAELANGFDPVVEGWISAVKIPTAPNGCDGTMPACRDLILSEGSKTAGPASADNEIWTSLSESTYQGMILNEDTGAKVLQLPFVNSSTDPIELIRRPPTGESATSILSQSRLYNLAQVRVLLSDNVADLPGGTGVQLTNVSPYYVFGLYGLTNTAFAEVDSTYSPFANGVPLIDGYLQVQGRQADSSYADVTLEWLNLGIARDNPNAILKFQEIHDRSPLDGLPDSGQTLDDPDDSWPLTLYDAREGEVRDLASNSTCALGGIMNLIELDVGNLGQWLTGAIGTTGSLVESASQNGYLLYFSDRRGMLPNGGGDMVGYGYEDLVNPADAAGAPNGTLDTAEDVNQSGALDTYGANNLGNGFGVANGDPTLRINCVDLARVHQISGARHALKLVNGSLGNLPTPGFTVGSENPVYVQGDYNANAGFGDPHAAAAIVADSVTFLSNNWGNYRSFLYPNDPSLRPATPTWYRVAVAAGKTMTWPNPGWSSNADDGLDGGTHNFVRYLEDWGSQTLSYRGSLVSLYYSQYAFGAYKCCDSVYSPPSRDYAFDTDFLDPANLPPGTPRLQDIVALGFRQLFSSN
jgi:hypothetical protein